MKTKVSAETTGFSPVNDTLEATCPSSIRPRTVKADAIRQSKVQSPQVLEKTSFAFLSNPALSIDVILLNTCYQQNRVGYRSVDRAQRLLRTKEGVGKKDRWVVRLACYYTTVGKAPEPHPFLPINT